MNAFIVDRKQYRVKKDYLSCEEILSRAGKLPEDSYTLYFRVSGAQPTRIRKGEKVFLAGIEMARFVTLPLEQTDGAQP